MPRSLNEQVGFSALELEVELDAQRRAQVGRRHQRRVALAEGDDRRLVGDRQVAR
jgi:hypothetical protein